MKKPNGVGKSVVQPQKQKLARRKRKHKWTIRLVSMPDQVARVNATSIEGQPPNAPPEWVALTLCEASERGTPHVRIIDGQMQYVLFP